MVNGRKFTLIILSPRRGKLRQLRLGKAWFVFGVCFILLSLALGGYGIHRHARFVDETRLLEALVEENHHHAQRFQQLGSKIEDLREQLAQFHKLDKKIRIIANLDDGASEVRFPGMGGVNGEAGIPQGLPREQWGQRIRERLQGLRELSEQQEASFRHLEEALEEKKDLLACTPSIWPTQGWLSCGFGYRQSPFTGLREFHRGVDVANRLGTPVIAPADGVVVETEKDRGFGLFVRIEHGFGYQTFYAHLDDVVVDKGQEIKRGQLIGNVGNTGRSTGPHLHYEIHVSGLAVNPLRYILN